MTVELSSSHGGSGLVNKQRLIASLHPAAPPQMVHVEVEHIIAEKGNGSCIPLSFPARTAYQLFHISIKSFTCSASFHLKGC